MKSYFHSLIPFLPFLLKSPSTAISRTRPNSRQQPTLMNFSSIGLSQLLTTTICSLGTSRYIASGRIPRKYRLLLSRIVLGVFADPLPSNRRPIVARVCSRGNMFTESLPSNGSIRHNIQLPSEKNWHLQAVVLRWTGILSFLRKPQKLIDI
jgi:hypothetical protein